MKTSFDCKRITDQMIPIGKANGYQHIWKEAVSTLDSESYSYNWIGNEKFYTLHSVSEVGDEIILGRAGANDPEFNLRPDPVLIHRRNNAKSSTFINLIESHGIYNRVTEVPIVPYSVIKSIELAYSSEDHTIFTFSSDTFTWEFMIAQSNNNKEAQHSKTVDGKEYSWTGFYKLNKLKKD